MKYKHLGLTWERDWFPGLGYDHGIRISALPPPSNSAVRSWEMLPWQDRGACAAWCVAKSWSQVIHCEGFGLVSVNGETGRSREPYLLEDLGVLLRWPTPQWPWVTWGASPWYSILTRSPGCVSQLITGNHAWAYSHLQLAAVITPHRFQTPSLRAPYSFLLVRKTTAKSRNQRKLHGRFLAKDSESLMGRCDRFRRSLSVETF